ncbi:MAG: 50S ribosomal protein L28 [Bacteroidales bacterium]|jgi:large subunit ribosomal protein L28
MSRICQITGKRVLVGNHVAHSKKRVKRKFYPNLNKKKFYLPEEDRWIDLKVSAHGIRIINKVGLKVALEGAKKKGIIETY